MKKSLLLSLLFISVIFSYAQERPTYIDGIKLSPQEAKNSKIEIVSMTMKADGTYMVSRAAAQNAFYNYFRSKSVQYAVAVPIIKDIYNVQYVINTTVLTHDFDEVLANVNDKNLVSFKVIEKETLVKDYGITDKTYGIIIFTKKLQK